MAPNGGTKPWTTTELRLLRASGELGARAAARLLGRSVWSVKQAAYRSRISLRSRGCRRGSVLGQPRGVSLRADLREDLLNSKATAEAVARRLVLWDEAALCPSCARRRVEVKITGLCGVCHTRRLTEAHLAELEKLDAQRALWTSRQALCRARKAAANR
jgi:hypothetical protein